MLNFFGEVLNNYQKSMLDSFAGSYMANLLRNDIPQAIRTLVKDDERFFIKGSAGQSRWTFAPWVAMLDLIVTNTPQSGYYPVFLFREDFSGFYLSLNQGVTDIKNKYKKDALLVLRIKSEDYRAQLTDLSHDFPETEISLGSEGVYKSKDAKFYEAGNIVAKYYSRENLPSESHFVSDILIILRLYRSLTYNQTIPTSKAEIEEDERKFKGIEDLQKFRLHKKIERNTVLIKKVKSIRGYTCEICTLNFEERYGEIGQGFIEAHHLVPISTLGSLKIQLDVRKDFRVLCSNCHRMIHRQDDVTDIERLRDYILKNPLKSH